MNLTKNFTLAELSITSQKADNTPPADAIPKLLYLCMAVLQPLRDHLGKPVNVNSGFRSTRVNALLPGSSRTSQHMCLGQCAAADIWVAGMTPAELAAEITKLGLAFDQLITEPSWVHVSVVVPRFEILDRSGK